MNERIAEPRADLAEVEQLRVARERRLRDPAVGSYALGGSIQVSGIAQPERASSRSTWCASRSTARDHGLLKHVQCRSCTIGLLDPLAAGVVPVRQPVDHQVVAAPAGADRTGSIVTRLDLESRACRRASRNLRDRAACRISSKQIGQQMSAPSDRPMPLCQVGHGLPLFTLTCISVAACAAVPRCLLIDHP